MLPGLYRREKTGQGCHVYAALVAEGAWATGMWLQAALDGASFYPKIDRRRPPDPLVNTYQASDQRWFLLVAEEEKWWETLAGVVCDPERGAADRVPDRVRRSPHTDRLTPLRAPAFQCH